MILSLKPVTKSSLEEISTRISLELDSTQLSIKNSLVKYEKNTGMDFQTEIYLADQLNFLSNIEYIKNKMFLASLVSQQSDQIQVYDKLATQIRRCQDRLTETLTKLTQVTNAQLTELASYRQPPTWIKLVAEAVCLLFTMKPDYTVFKRFIRVHNFITKVSRVSLRP